MFSIKHLIVIGALVTVGLTAYPTKEKRDDAEFDLHHNSDIVDYRLPNHTHPESYDLSLVTRIDLGEFDYQGFVKIGIVVDEPTRQIVLHKSHLTILDVKLTRVDGPTPLQVPLQPYGFNAMTELLSIVTNGTILNTGERLVLEISFSNTIAIGRGGFFRHSYEDSTGNKT